MDVRYCLANGRLLLYQGLLETVWEKPFIGHGMGMTEPVCLSVGTKRIRNPHNEYLGVAIQSGFIGLFLYCFFLATILLVSFKQSTPWKELGIFIAVALIVDGLFNCALSYSSASRFYGILLAVVFSQYRSRQTSRRSLEKSLCKTAEQGHEKVASLLKKIESR